MGSCAVWWLWTTRSSSAAAQRASSPPPRWPTPAWPPRCSRPSRRSALLRHRPPGRLRPQSGAARPLRRIVRDARAPAPGRRPAALEPGVGGALGAVLRDGRAVRPARGWGSLTKLASRRRARRHERPRVARRRPSTTRASASSRPPSCAWRRSSPTTTRCPPTSRAPSCASAAWPGVRYLDRRLAVDDRRARQPGRAARRDAAHPRRRPLPSSAPGDRWTVQNGRARGTTRTRSSSRPGCRAAFAKLIDGLVPPGPPA